MGRLVKIDPATEEKNGQAAVTATGAGGRLVKTGDVQRTSPAGNTIRAQPQTSTKTPYQKALDEAAAKRKKGKKENTSFGARALKGAGSGIVAEGANLANLGGVVTDRRGGTGMSDIYREQVELLDSQIAALEKTLKNPKMSAQNISDTKEALALARSEREKYSRAAESGEKTAKSLYETADKGYSLAQKLGNESTAGTKGVKKGVLKVIPAATQIGLQTAERMVAPGFDMIGRAASVAGGSAADYRHKAGTQYDVEKAALRATVSALGVAAGGALSKGVNAAGLKLLRAAGKQNHILPNVLLGGANAAGYAAGETGASELSKAMTEEDYTPDWGVIGQTAMTAFAFGAITSAINAAAMTGRNKRYMNELNDAVKERYNYAKRIIEDPRATAGQKAAGAESVMNAADKMRGALDELQVVGAQKEVDAMREFLLSIYGEMMPYTNTNAGGIGTGAAGIMPVTPGGGVMTVRPGEGTNPMQEAAPTAPITPRAPGAAAAAQNTMPAQPVAAQEGVQGMGEGNLTTVPQNAAQGAQEAKADALDAGGRVPLDRYATPENAQQVSQEINNGTLAVDSHNKIYRVDAGEHIDRRDSASVGERSVNAFQFDHPELHQYFAEAAADLSEEMSFAQRGGELVRRTSHEAGDDEHIRTKRGVSERIARLLDDEGVRYDDIDRSIEAIIHNHGQENFAAAKRVELLLDEMLTNGYTDIHGRYVAPNERYIEAKRGIPGADTSARTREELPLWDMAEGQNGGIYGRQEENAGGLEPAEAGGQRADAVAAEGDLYRGDGRRGAAEPGPGGTGQLRKGAKGEEYRKVVAQRRKAAVLEPVTSAQELGVPGGTESQTLHVLPEEAWDDELREFAAWARKRGVQHVTMVTGLLQVNTEHGAVGVRGIINRDSGEMVLRADPDGRSSASEIGKHEIGHLITEEADVRAFMEEVKRGGNWHGIYEVYERCYEPLTGGYIGMTAAERELYVWEEIMEDAYAGLDSYGQRASLYHEQAVGLLDRAPEVPAHTVSEPENVRLRAVDEPKGRGPPERFSYAGRDARNADLEALHEAERYEMQNVDAETIRQKTGWFRGADGKWRWEIDDSDMKLRADAADISNYTTLGELVDAPALFATYPDMKDMSVTFHDLERGQLGGYLRTFDSIELSRELKQKPEALLNSLTHEVQHAIQQREGFTPGANPKYWNRKLEEGYDGRDAETRREGARLREQYEQMEANDPEFMRSMEELNAMAPTVPRGKIDPDTWEQIEPDPPEWERFDERRDQLEEKYGDRVWDYFSLRDSIDRNARDGRLPGDLYRDTAGEIEARDAASRRSLTAEERRGRKPDTGDENTVFADGGESYSIRNTKDIPYQKQIDAFYSGDSKTVGRSDDIYIAGADNSLSALGIGEKPFFMLKSNLRKSTRIAGNNPSNSAHGISESVIRKLPELIKSPALIVQGDGRISIIPGITVKTEKNNTAPLLIAVNPNGSVDGIDAYEIKSIYGRENFANWLDLRARDSKIIAGDEKKAAALLRDVGKQYPEPVAYAADLTDAILSQSKGDVKSPTMGDEIRRQIMGTEAESLPGEFGYKAERPKDYRLDDNVSDDGGNVKTKTRFSVEDETDSTGRELTAQQQEYFKDSEVRDEDGRLIPVYHGSQAQFTEFSADFMSMHGSMEGQGFYFTDNRSMAEGYKRDGGQLLEGYLNISKPLSDSEVTMTKAELKKLLKAVDPTGDDVVINYDPTGGMGYPSKAWYNRALAATVEQIYSTSDSDSEILADVANSGAGAGETTRAARKALGYDGYIVKGKYDNATVYVAFESNQFKNAGNKTPTENQDIRFSAEDEDGGEWDKKLARMPESVQEAVQRVKGSRGSSMREFPNLDAYLSDKGAQLAAEKAERLRNRGKDEFGGTKALEKLGVKIENSAGDYSVVDQLIANDQAAKIIQRETRKAIKRLGATPKEQNFARNIASGLYDEEDIPTTMNRGKVMQLADYYSAEKSMSTDLIKERRREIGERLQEKMEDLFDEHFEGEFSAPKRGKGIAPESGLALYHRTPQRSMRAIFGWDRGQQINEAIFEPVYVNEQERKRFANRMHDEVRTFAGTDGEDAALTQRERALAQLLIEGKAVEEMVGKSEIKQQIIHAAENLLDGAEMTDAAREFGLHGKEERELAQRYADWLETKRELDSGSVDKTRVENAAKKYSGLYDEFYAAINDFLVAHGYEPIGFIKGYAPHFQPEAESNKLESALKAIGVDLGAEVGKLPASIAGLTKEFKPNKRYNPFFQHRKGTSTDYDIQKGFEKYIDYLSDVLYHTDDVMRVRAAAKYFRRKYAPDNISALIEQAEDLKFATPEEKELFLKTNGIVDDDVKLSYQAMNRAMEQYTEDLFNDVTQTTKYGDLVTWLDDYGNKLAGKQLFNDRSMEREVGRTSLNVGRKLVSTFARANVAGNLSSSLNQTAQLPLIAGELGPKYVAEAIGDIARGKAKGDFADRSDFLTEKRGIRYLTNTKGDKITEALFWPLERMDYLMSTIAVRGRYRKELAEGKSEKEALRAADRWGRDVMGSRSKGTAPLTFQSKNLISQMVNLFQVEALNSWEHVSQDIFGPGLREMEAKLGKKEASRRLAGVIVGTLLGAFLLNRADEELYGGTPAQFDVLGLLAGFLASGNGLTTNEQLGVWFDDVWQKMTGERLFGTDEDAGNDKFNLAAAAEDTLYNISNDVPYVRNVSGLLGVGDQTLPMPDLYGTAKGIGGAFADAAEGDMRSFSEEIARQLMGLAGDTLPGGRQAEKTAQGIEAVARGGSYKGSGDSKRLQYPVESPMAEPWTALRAAIFGKNALPESRTYWAAGGKALSAAQTRLYEDLVDSGLSRKRAYEILKRFNDATADLEADRDKNGNPIGGSKKEKIVKEINKLPLSRKQKNMLYLSRGYSEKDLNSLPWN